MPSSLLPPATLAAARPPLETLRLSSFYSLRNIAFPFLHLQIPTRTLTVTPIRMGGGPRTYPGGVSKWQWKRMQVKKAKQLLKARLARERRLYEMRKRAELKTAVAELEKPWELVDRAPALFSVAADEQVKALADRFQKPGGFDMWTERDGPQVFRSPGGLPSARFFPKGAVHSVKPYGISTPEGEEAGLGYDDWIARGGGGVRRRSRRGELRGEKRGSEFIDVEAKAQAGKQEDNKLAMHAKCSMDVSHGDEEENTKISQYRNRRMRGLDGSMYVLAEFEDSIEENKQPDGDVDSKSISLNCSKNCPNEEEMADLGASYGRRNGRSGSYDRLRNRGNGRWQGSDWLSVSQNKRVGRNSDSKSTHSKSLMNYRSGEGSGEGNAWASRIEEHGDSYGRRSQRSGSYDGLRNRRNGRWRESEGSSVSDSEIVAVGRREERNRVGGRREYGSRSRRFGAQRASEILIPDLLSEDDAQGIMRSSKPTLGNGLRMRHGRNQG